MHLGSVNVVIGMVLEIPESTFPSQILGLGMAIHVIQIVAAVKRALCNIGHRAWNGDFGDMGILECIGVYLLHAVGEVDF